MLSTTNAVYASSVNYDKVIYSDSITISATLPGGVTVPLVTNIGQGALPVGIFSYDGGVTWNDVAGNAISSSINNNITIQPSFSLNLSVHPTTGAVNAVVAGITGSAGTVTIQIKYVLLALDSSSVLTRFPVTTTNPTAFTTIKGVYREIKQSGTLVTSGGTTYNTAHNQTNIPLINNWSVDSAGRIGTQALLVDSRWTTSGAAGYVIALNSTTITTQFVAFAAFSGYIYRVYGPQS